MGEIADMMLDGTLCAGCGVSLGNGDGFPEYCPACKADGQGYDDGITKTKCGQPRPSKTNCPDCGKLVKKAGLADHQRDAHGTQQIRGTHDKKTTI